MGPFGIREASEAIIILVRLDAPFRPEQPLLRLDGPF